MFEIITMIVSGLFILSTSVPLLKWDWWPIRSFDFPQLQFFCFGLFCLLLYAFIYPFSSDWLWIVLICVVLSLIYLLWIILPYTTLSKKTVPDWIGELNEHGEAATVKILSSNVLMNESGL